MTKLLVGLDDHAPQQCANDMVMAKNIADALNNHYPGHLWAINVDGANGIVTIMDLMLSGTWGYLLKIPAIYSESSFKQDVLRAGGEILERFRMARGRFDEAQYAQLATDFAGQPEFDK